MAVAAEVDVLQLISDTDRRGPQVAAVELAAALAPLGTTVRTVALARGRSATALDVAVVEGHLALRRAVHRSRVVLGQGSTTLWASALATTGSGQRFVYRSIGDASVWARSGHRRVRFGAAVRRAAGVVALWPGAADALVERFGVDPARVAVVPQAAPAARFPLVDASARRAARATLGLPVDDPIVLFLGALAAEKRVDVAIDAVLAAPALRLLIAGDGPLEADLRRRGDPAGDRIRFLGAVDDPRCVLAAADVLVLPSLTEGVPGVLVEAGLSGLPTVATAVGGVPSVITDGVTGVLVPAEPDAVADGIWRAIADPAMGANARRRCLEAFTLEFVGPRWRMVLERAMRA